MKVLASLLALTAFPLGPLSCEAGVITDIPADRQAIITNDDWEDKQTTQHFNCAWTPTFGQAHAALVEVERHLEQIAGGLPNPSWESDLKAVPSGKVPPNVFERREVRKILSFPDGWRVQFWPVTLMEKSGLRKAVVCNFFPAKSEGIEFPDWKTKRVEVDDGGYCFWHAYYYLDTKKCEIGSNGYAQADFHRPALVAMAQP